MRDDINSDEKDDDVHGIQLRQAVIEKINFDLDAFIGSASLSLDEIEGLKSGSIITLSTKINETISLQLNGVEIAKGELVSVDDNFAVKITSLTN